MGWKLSRFRAGDVVEVRSREEILAALDAKGCLDGTPFMPEMLAFCGKRFRVRAVAHKTCDTATKTKGRRLNETVHLAGVFCDGSAHGGCEAECALFWKDAWLKPADDHDARVRNARRASDGCTEAELQHLTRRAEAPDADPVYRCQATEIVEYTALLPAWDLRQYVYDVRTGNRSASHVLRVLFLASLRWVLQRTPAGYRLFDAVQNRVHLALSGRPSPKLAPHIEPGRPTPTGRLDLRPGEKVRIKSQPEIEPTLDMAGKNRGLSFDPQEMAPYCDRVVTVRKAVTRIIDEPTGKMIVMKQPCIMLEGVVCTSDYATSRLNCPRAIPSYWRELWLERVAATDNASGDGEPVSAPGAPRR